MDAASAAVVDIAGEDVAQARVDGAGRPFQDVGVVEDAAKCGEAGVGEQGDGDEEYPAIAQSLLQWVQEFVGVVVQHLGYLEQAPVTVAFTRHLDVHRKPGWAQAYGH